MKSYSFLLLSILQVLLLNAQSKWDKEPYMTKSLASESISNVQVQTSGGSISVTGVNPSEARIEVYVSPSNNRDNDLSKEEIKRRLEENYDLIVSTTNNKLTATAKHKRQNIDWKKALNIAFKVFVPKNISTDLATSGGSIHLTGITGDQNFSTSGGSLHIDNVAGKTNGRTSGGSIHLVNSRDDIVLSTSGGSIEAVKSSGNIKLSTSGGSLKLSDLNGNISANTSGGSVEANDIQGELLAHTSGGGIKLRDLACSLETSTSGGHIDVAMKDLGKYIKISNSGGNIELQMPKNKGFDLNLHATKINTDNLGSFTGTKDEDKVEGKLNGGGIPVTVSAGSGRISLSLK